ncbi:aldose epimerase family protein [Streptomyces sp. NPDC093085]|uniref:aldose epimerase family protein n=1 Tax=Streptomyces sp. NPDC093085 TaxID=3155068 RepID=UPI00342A5CDE
MNTERVGATPEGTPVDRWTLERAGTRVRLLTYGGILQSVEVPDRNGAVADVVLGFPELTGYLENRGPYFGALVGRYANRIAGAAFTLDGVVHRVTPNEGPNCLHGGAYGFDRRVWEAEPVGEGTDGAGRYGVRLSRVSPDGEEGFPGRLAVSATYTLDATGALRIAYRAVTDAPTHLTLTNHTYWNLGGPGAAPATSGHELRIAAGRITPVDGAALPTGELAPVDATRFDFRTRRPVGPGYDHNYVLDEVGDDAPAAELYDPVSGRVLTVATSEPGIQLYTGDHFDGKPFGPGAGIALETQHFPDSPNQPSFPSTVLRPGEVFASRTTYRFGTRTGS